MLAVFGGRLAFWVPSLRVAVFAGGRLGCGVAVFVVVFRRLVAVSMAVWVPLPRLASTPLLTGFRAEKCENRLLLFEPVTTETGPSPRTQRREPSHNRGGSSHCVGSTHSRLIIYYSSPRPSLFSPPSWPCGWLSRGPSFWVAVFVAGRLRRPSGFLGAVFAVGRPVAVFRAVSSAVSSAVSLLSRWPSGSLSPCYASTPPLMGFRTLTLTGGCT